MENFKQKFIDTAYTKFGVKANGSINFEQAFEIIDEIEQCNIAKVVGQAAGIITAVRDENWKEMLKIFPEGIEHRTWKYDCPAAFTEWESYEEYSRYVAPAREMMKEKCLNKALEYLNACS